MSLPKFKEEDRFTYADYLTWDVSREEILADYPHLNPEAISACLTFAAHAIKNEIYFELKAA